MTTKRLKTSVACAFLATILLGSTQSYGATFHVSPFGSNTPPYDTYTKAAHRIKDAADLATATGDTVLVHAGNYTSTDTIYIALGVTFAGVGRDSVTINWGGAQSEPARMVSLAGGNEVCGLELRNPLGDFWNPDIGGLHTYSLGHISVHDCRFSEVDVYLDGDGTLEVFDNHFYRRQIWALYAGRAHNWIHGNLFEDGGTGVRTSYAGHVIIENNVFQSDVVQTQLVAVDVYSCDSVEIRNNLVYNADWTINWAFASGLIENNTFVRARYKWATMFIFLDPNQRLTVRNNVFVGMASPMALGPSCSDCNDTPGTTIIAHNVIWPPRDSLYILWPPWPPHTPPERVSVSESLNVYAYPMFADESTYCPQAGSPLIDSGDPALSDVDLTQSDIGWHGGPGGTSCDYPQFPPLAPESLWVSGAGGLISLIWSARHEADLEEYRLYRGSSSGFWTPGMTPHRVLNPADTAVTDTLLSAGDSYYYVVTASDTAELESEPSPERSFIVSGILDDPVDSPIPRTPYIARIYPNPFNAATTMEVFIPDVGAMPAPVRIMLYDVMGRLVSVPLDGSLNPGNHAIPISATDAQGRALASGVYFARLRVWSTEFGGVKKLVVLK